MCCSFIAYVNSCIDFILIFFFNLFFVFSQESALEQQTIILTPLQSPSPPSTISPLPHPPQCPPNWITTLHVPWEKMAPTLRQAISTEKKGPPTPTAYKWSECFWTQSGYTAQTRPELMFLDCQGYCCSISQIFWWCNRWGRALRLWLHFPPESDQNKSGTCQQGQYAL